MTMSTVQMLSSVPGNDPWMLRGIYQNKLIASLKLFFNKTAASVKIDLSRQLSKLDTLDPNRRFSPLLYVIYSYVREGYIQHNLGRLLDGVQLFNNCSIEECYAEKIIYNTILSEPWELSFIDEWRNSQVHEDESLTSTSIGLYPLVNWKKEDFPPLVVKEALGIWKELDPTLFHEFDVYISSMKFFYSKDLNSLTSPKFFGAMLIKAPDETLKHPLFYYLDHLVHEVSHLHLFAMMGEDPMVLNTTEEVFDSPLRRDKRPMLGVFHATFVLARIVRILRKFVKQEPLAQERLTKQEHSFRQGLNTVLSQAKLTEKGKNLVDTLEECAFV